MPHRLASPQDPSGARSRIGTSSEPRCPASSPVHDQHQWTKASDGDHDLNRNPLGKVPELSSPTRFESSSCSKRIVRPERALWRVRGGRRHYRASLPSQVIPEGAGPVKSVGRSFFLPATSGCWRADEGSGSRLGRSPTAERPEGLDGDPVRRIAVGLSRDGVVFLSGCCRVGWAWLASGPALPVGAGGGCSVIPSRRPAREVRVGAA